MPSELDFERLRLVGKGSFGEAFLVRSRLDGRQYVMKIAALGKGERMRRALSEVDILIKCGDGHRNVCAYRGSFLSGDGSKLCILMDFYEGGDLRQKVKRRAKNLAAVGYFSEDEVLGYLTQLCDGLNHIHERNILHRDLKSQNVFVTQEGGEETLKIGDFGISTELEGPEDWARTRIGRSRARTLHSPLAAQAEAHCRYSLLPFSRNLRGPSLQRQVRHVEPRMHRVRALRASPCL
jgi:NIMA (never in mitosis gene a)-related kinase